MTEENKKDLVLGTPEPYMEESEEIRAETMDSIESEENESLGESIEEVKNETLLTQQAPSPVWKKLETDYHAYAGFWVRFWAYLIDLAVIGAFQAIFVRPFVLGFGWDTSGFITPYTIISGIIFFAYFVLMTKLLGQTLGKMVFGLKVIPLKREGLTWDVVIFRECVGRYISKAFGGILYIVVGILPKKQGIHDLFAETSVVHETYIKKEKLLENQL